MTCNCVNSSGLYIPSDVALLTGLVSVVATGGAAVMVIPIGAYGGYIWNPLTDADQGVTAEPLYINPIEAPSLEAFGGTLALEPGDTYLVPVAKSVTGIWVNAATSGHRFTVIYWTGP